MDGVQYLQEFDAVEKVEGNSLFIGMWSITEVPTNERGWMLENLKFFDCKNIFIGMGGMFKQENNIEWLENTIIPKLEVLGYEHKLVDIKHGRDMFYFIATKK